MNENEIYVVKEYKFDNPLITDLHSITDSCFKNCYDNYFHNFIYECLYDIKFTNITNNDIINLTIIVKNMNLYELNKKLKVARNDGFIFNQINKLTIKCHWHLRSINISYFMKFPIPMCHRQFFRVISQNRELVQTNCNDRNKSFHFACRKRYLYNNPHC